jgi:hypothetical protein
MSMMVYYVMALTLYMEVSYEEVLRCLLQGLDWLGWPIQKAYLAGRAAISEARMRLGVQPMRRLYEECVQPVSNDLTQGACYRTWRLVSLDGSTLDVADTPDNEATFGRPGASRGRSGFPQMRFVCLAEIGTRILFGAQPGPSDVGERTLATRVVTRLESGMLCLADRGFYGAALWRAAQATGADLLWRVSEQVVLPCHQLLADGSYLSKVYPSPWHRLRDQEGLWVRVVDYRLEGIEGAEPIYRLLTTLLDPEQTPAQELAALYHERWEIETAFDEIKTHLRGGRILLRSKTPDLVYQEFYGLLLTHSILRGLIHEAAARAHLDPDELSFVHAVRVVRRKLPLGLCFPPSGEVEPLQPIA